MNNHLSKALEAYYHIQGYESIDDFKEEEKANLIISIIFDDPKLVNVILRKNKNKIKNIFNFIKQKDNKMSLGGEFFYGNI